MSIHNKSLSRLAAVQALYQIDVSGTSEDLVIAEFLSGELGGEAFEILPGKEVEEVVPLGGFAPALFAQIVREATLKQDSIDAIITANLSDQWPVDRLESTVRCILRAGIAELIFNKSVSTKVIISEFIDIAHAFYEGAEPSMVNAILDIAAKALRSG